MCQKIEEIMIIVLGLFMILAGLMVCFGALTGSIVQIDPDLKKVEPTVLYFIRAFLFSLASAMIYLGGTVLAGWLSDLKRK